LSARACGCPDAEDFPGCTRILAWPYCEVEKERTLSAVYYILGADGCEMLGMEGRVVAEKGSEVRQRRRGGEKTWADRPGPSMFGPERGLQMEGLGMSARTSL
jgi:hypothetical protein